MFDSFDIAEAVSTTGGKTHTLAHELAHIHFNHFDDRRDVEDVEIEAGLFAYLVSRPYGVDSTRFAAEHLAEYSDDDTFKVLGALARIEPEIRRYLR